MPFNAAHGLRMLLVKKTQQRSGAQHRLPSSVVSSSALLRRSGADAGAQRAQRHGSVCPRRPNKFGKGASAACGRCGASSDVAITDMLPSSDVAITNMLPSSDVAITNMLPPSDIAITNMLPSSDASSDGSGFRRRGRGEGGYRSTMVLMPVPNPKNTTTMPVMTPITCRQKKNCTGHNYTGQR